MIILERESVFLSFNFNMVPVEGILFAIRRDITVTSSQRDDAQKVRDPLYYETHG